MAFAHPTVVFAKRNIEYPMQTVFDFPMTARRVGKGLGIGYPLQADVEHTLGGRLALDVAYQMQLGRALGGTELRPVIHGQAQINHGRIGADQFVLGTELLFANRFLGDDLKQSVKYFLEQRPRAMTVGVGQRRARRSLDAQAG